MTRLSQKCVYFCFKIEPTNLYIKRMNWSLTLFGIHFCATKKNIKTGNEYDSQNIKVP